MIIKIVILVALAIGLFLLYVATKSSKMEIVRQILIKATPDKIFPFINNSKKMNDWMPWQDCDPQVKMNYMGPDEGVGAISSWDSPGKMGAGQAKVIESVADKVVKTQLTYTRPMNMSQLAEISLTPSGDGTLVRWSVTGENNFMGRLVCTFMNMDKRVGGQFEKGLNKLKIIVEGGKY